MNRHSQPHGQTSPPRSRPFLWRFYALVEGMLLGDRKWGAVRLIMLMAVFGLILMTAYLVEGGLDYLLLIVHPQPVTFDAWLETPAVLRAVFLPLVIVVIVLYTAGKYVSDIYNIKSDWLGVRYIIASVFGLLYPILHITGGKMDLKKDEKNLLDKIGGPGYIEVEPGNAVLFEQLTGPSDVVSGHRWYFVPRFARIKEIVELRNQNDEIQASNAITRDGIEVVCRNIRYQFQVHKGKPAGPGFGRTADNPFPFSPQAIRRIAYDRSVTARGYTPWREAVKFIIDGAITDYVADNWFDQLTVPLYSNKPDPRQTITHNLRSAGVRKRLREMGAELLWCDIGTFDSPYGEQPRISAWEAKWSGQSHVVLSEGEAEKEALQELGRIEGQADILRSIIRALETINLSQSPRENLRSVFLARTAQVLESLSDQHGLNDQDRPQPGPERGNNGS